MTDTCQFKGCDRKATHSTAIEIPAKGYAFDSHTPLKLYTGNRCCKDHATEAVDLKGTMEMLKPMLDDIAKNMRLTPPDGERARVRAVRLDSEEYVTYEKMSNKGPLQ